MSQAFGTFWKKPTEYRAPSWSWASMEAPVQFIPLAYQDLVARVVKCETAPSGNDIYGRVKDGRLVIEGAIFEIFPHEPKKEWKRHGIPVEIRFDPDDDRETSIGALFLDLADEPLPSPYFALFLDSGNALVLRTRHGRPVIAPGEIPGYSATGVDDLDVIVTSSDVLRQTKTRPETKDWVFQAFANTERIGVASFDGIPQRKDEAKDDSPIDLDKLTLDDIVSVPAKESWGLVTKEDPKVRVTII